MVSIRRRREDPSTPGGAEGGQGTVVSGGDDVTAPFATRPREEPPAAQQTATFAAVPRQGGEDAPSPPAASGATPEPARSPYRSEWPTPPPSAETAREHDAIGDPAYERFGGVNLGAAFFGWMVALGMTVLLSAVAGGVALALGVTRVEFDSQALTTGSLVSAGVVLLVLVLAYYCGGYVAGRMSRFDGVRQGFAVWALALLFAVLGGLAGWAAGERWGSLPTDDLPSVQVSTSDLTTAGLVAAGVILLGTLLAALAGGKVGHRYHTKVDRAL